jgi:hypothetical protein
MCTDLLRPYLQLEVIKREFCHDFAAVQHQIQEHLLQLHVIPAYQREVRIEPERETDMPDMHVTVQELHNLSDDLVEIDRKEFERALAQQTVQPVDHLDGPFIIFSACLRSLRSRKHAMPRSVHPGSNTLLISTGTR